MELGNTMLRNNENTDIAVDENDNLLQRFIAYVDATEATVRTYKRTLKQFFKYLADNHIKEPKREDILNFKTYLRELGRKPTTIQNYIIVVRLFFKWTSQENIYPNIADRVKGAKLDTAHKKDYLTSEQIKDVLDNIDTSTLKGARDYAMISLMVTTGLRTIEVARAEVDDIRNVGDTPVLYIKGKGKEEKTDYVKLPLQVIKAIGRYRSMLTDEHEKLFVSTSNNNKGKALTTCSVSTIVKTAMKNAGYNSPRLTAHSLRHSTATLNLLGGGTLEETQQLLRHSKISTTMVYLHHLERANNQSEKRVANSIFANEM
ncbi:site-specific integrase [Staphylococcus capitis]|uniref:tyrosine-type recombinase/integrase n=2 Tax=Staphylococcus capitis TaxID=29388 RepID=UPI001E52D9B9|nr:tyrosine-type recombinase/integrase [Staphylococcus capitis]MCC9117512.1 site-specific integrase [Staphylococcus capitis]MCC9143962.1 site-specific integrase [Staphylococcus capitis]